MTHEELDHIESMLEIQLPAAYRDFMAEFPLRACAGNSEFELWDDAEALIRQNRWLRSGEKGAPAPWPRQFFCVGHAGGTWVHAIDLEDPQAAVWYVEHFELGDPATSACGSNFVDWATEHLKLVRDDLLTDGIDPDAPAAERNRVEARNARSERWLLLGIIVTVTIVILAGAWLYAF